MALEIKVPTLGESVTEATVGQWFKNEGDAVARDEPLVELETDKVTIEVPAPAAGTLASIAVKDGETVEVGALLGILAEGEAGKAAPVAAAPKPRRRLRRRRRRGPPRPRPEMPPAPSAAKLMEEKGVSPADVDGSGKRGQVLKGDVLEALERTAKAPKEAPAAARAPSAPPRRTTRRARSG